MEHEGQPIDWVAFEKAGMGGRLMDLLVKLPRERWAERNDDGDTPLHFACRGTNEAAALALLRSGLVDVNARNQWGRTPAHYAAVREKPRMLEVLCAAGADLRMCGKYGDSPLLIALFDADGETVRVLLANGVRLSTLLREDRHRITPELAAFERGVLCCRAAVVAMLHVKRREAVDMGQVFAGGNGSLCLGHTIRQGLADCHQ